VTNQRETTVAWDRVSKNVLCPAIVWSDVRTQDSVRRMIDEEGDARAFATRCGLPISTYFSATKMRWMLDHIPQVAHAARGGTLAFGTIDTWLMWKLSGEQTFVTDVTNASRTMLMNIETRQWDEFLCSRFRIPQTALPEIHSCSEKLALIRTNEADLRGLLRDDTYICGCIGDQQSALVGNLCFNAGEAKNTYGTGCFLLANVGDRAKLSRNGLLTTVGYQLGANARCVYALEGAIAGVGSCVQWMRDKLEFFDAVSESEKLARSVESTGGVIFIPAFSGLLAPFWDSAARGTIVGMTLQTSKAHIVRAAFESIAMQVMEVVRAMEDDAQSPFVALKVDGGMAHNSLVMEIQSDILGIPVDIPHMLETTALGAALCAGLAVGVWSSEDEILRIARKQERIKRVMPFSSPNDREKKISEWRRGLQRCRGWAHM
jgi:glycerol kinase